MDKGTTASPCSWRLRGDLFLVILLLAFAVRAGILLLMPDALARDPDGYRRLAENLASCGTFGECGAATAYRPPLYPLLLVPCVVLGEHARVAVGVLHVLLGVGTVGLVFLLGRWWGLGNRGAAVAAMLTACDPILLSQSAQIMTETPATFFVALGLAAITMLDRQSHRHAWTALLAGIVLALGALCRPTLLLWAIVVGVARMGVRGRFARREAFAFTLGAVMVLAPWAIRNEMQFGRPVVTTTHGGYTLLLANNPDFYQWLRRGAWGSVWNADDFNADWQRRAPHDELQADRLAYAEAWQNIRREPGVFLYASLVRVGRLWSPLPHQLTADESLPRRFARYAVALWYVLEFVVAGIGAWRLLRDDGFFSIPAFRLPASPFFYGLLLVACLTVVHALFWTDMRMRAVLMPIVAMAVAAAFADSRKE